MAVMPYISVSDAYRSATIVERRCGTEIGLVLVCDHERRGFISVANSVFNATQSQFFIYLAQDAFPGRDWLRVAVRSISESNAGLLAFNDGKWHGYNASFGMARRSFVNSLYREGIFFSEYRSHAADQELTDLAKARSCFVYEPNAVLIEVDYEKDLSPRYNKQDIGLYYRRKKLGFPYAFGL